MKGVLRGERSRFQLFGDTMNTAARMESNGRKDRIHLSQETAELLIAAGKNSWVTAREDKIIAKGKGELQTFWLTVTDRSDTNSSKKGDHTSGTFEFEHSMKEAAIDYDNGHESLDVKTLRLIDWHAEVLHRLLKQIVAKRIHTGQRAMGTSDLIYHPKGGENVLDEVKEIITLPQSKTAEDEYDVHAVQMDPQIMKQLTNFVTAVASMYRDNPFHNFEHASHVTMRYVPFFCIYAALYPLLTSAAFSLSNTIAIVLLSYYLVLLHLQRMM
jgi:Adenylate and Guanylate cyclase catalytic domain